MHVKAASRGASSLHQLRAASPWAAHALFAAFVASRRLAPEPPAEVDGGAQQRAQELAASGEVLQAQVGAAAPRCRLPAAAHRWWPPTGGRLPLQVTRVLPDLDRVALDAPGLGTGLLNTLLPRLRPLALAELVGLADREVLGQRQGLPLGQALGLGHPGRAALLLPPEEQEGEEPQHAPGRGCQRVAAVADYLRCLGPEEGRLLQRMAATAAVSRRQLAVRVASVASARGFHQVLLEEVRGLGGMLGAGVSLGEAAAL